jgi:exocyst complex component 1
MQIQCSHFLLAGRPRPRVASEAASSSRAPDTGLSHSSSRANLRPKTTERDLATSRQIPSQGTSRPSSPSRSARSHGPSIRQKNVERDPSSSRPTPSKDSARAPSPSQSARSHGSSRTPRPQNSRSRPSSPGAGLPSLLRPGNHSNASVVSSSTPVPERRTRATPSPIPPQDLAIPPTTRQNSQDSYNLLPTIKPPEPIIKHLDPPSISTNKDLLTKTRQQTFGPTTSSPTVDPASRRDANARISFFDPANQFIIDQLAFGGSDELELDDDSAQATLGNVEEMIEGYEWVLDDAMGRKASRGAADLIEARLLDELMALEKVWQYLELPRPHSYLFLGKYTLFPGI